MQLPVGETQSLIFLEPGTRADPLEELEAEIGAQRFLDHLIIALASPGGSDLGGPQQFVIQIDCSFSPHGIISVTERRNSFKTS